MNHEITHGPSFAMLRVDLQPGETVIAEAGAMVARNSPVTMQVKMNAGRKVGFFGKMKSFFVAVIRKMMGGETFFVNHFSVPQNTGSVWLAPHLSGMISHRRLNGETMILTAGSYLASAGDIDIKTKWGGLRAIFSKEGLFFLQVSGQGDLWFNSYGGIETIDVNGEYIVDNGHLVAWEGNLDYKITSAGGGLMGFVASGEGLVMRFKGQGRIYIQSRNLSSLVDWLTPMLPG